MSLQYIKGTKEKIFYMNKLNNLNNCYNILNYIKSIKLLISNKILNYYKNCSNNKTLNINYISDNKFFNNTYALNNYKIFTSRGAKRKMERTPVQKTEHFINITKNRSDPIPLTDEYYPNWLLDIESRKYRPSHYEFYAYAGVCLPEPEECITIFRNLKRTKKKYNFYVGRENYNNEKYNKTFKTDDRKDNEIDFNIFEMDEDDLLTTDASLSELDFSEDLENFYRENHEKNKLTSAKNNE